MDSTNCNYIDGTFEIKEREENQISKENIANSSNKEGSNSFNKGKINLEIFIKKIILLKNV